MAKATIQSIRMLSEKLHNRWMREFAGKPRHTRDLAELEKLLEKAAGLAHKAKGIPGEKGDAVEKVVVERWKLYRDERDAIADAQYDRPEVAEIHLHGQRIDRALAVWRRHYAGRDRRTRDLTRLDDMLQVLSTSIPRLEALAEHPEVKKESLEGLRGQLEVYKDERAEIEKLRRQSEPGQRPMFLLAEAQSALDQYRVYFAQQPRATCSPTRLGRLVGALARVTEELAGDASQAENVAILNQHLAAWRTELPLMQAAREGVEVRELTSQLGAVANQLFQIYQREFAGKERATRNLQLLSDMCDRLTELAELMTAHDAATREPLNRKNLTLVDERLRRYESEWVEIAKARGAAAAASAPGKAPAAAAKAPVALPGITIAKKGD